MQHMLFLHCLILYPYSKFLRPVRLSENGSGQNTSGILPDFSITMCVTGVTGEIYRRDYCYIPQRVETDLEGIYLLEVGNLFAGSWSSGFSNIFRDTPPFMCSLGLMLKIRMCLFQPILLHHLKFIHKILYVKVDLRYTVSRIWLEFHCDHLRPYSHWLHDWWVIQEWAAECTFIKIELMLCNITSIISAKIIASFLVLYSVRYNSDSRW